MQANESFIHPSTIEKDNCSYLSVTFHKMADIQKESASLCYFLSNLFEYIYIILLWGAKHWALRHSIDSFIIHLWGVWHQNKAQ